MTLAGNGQHETVENKRWRTKIKQLDIIAAVLLVMGGLNWALVGAARFDLMAAIFGMHFGETSAFSSVVYLLVGLSAVFQAISWKAIPRRWSGAPAVARAH